VAVEPVKDLRIQDDYLSLKNGLPNVLYGWL
jgi:hypothetical protein